MEKNTLDLIACPYCKGKLHYHKKNQELICRFDKVAFPIRDGIPIMLIEKARAINIEELKKNAVEIGEIMTEFHVIIPARFASTRLPAKMLVDIAGKPLLQHTYERAIKSGAASVAIATDDNRIKELAASFGAKVCLTDKNHDSGTSRIAEAARIFNYSSNAIIVNVQGDEPLIPPVIIKQAAEALEEHQDADVATLCVPIASSAELFNPNVTKVVMDKFSYAIYFSRAPIPYERDNFLNNNTDLTRPLTSQHYRHIGIYAYRFTALQNYVNSKTTELETTERLEQLRVLWNGGKIYVEIAKEDSPISVDSQADLEKARKLINYV